MDSVSSGLLMIIGQMTDGIATPIVGYGLDKIGLCGSKYGRRKSWHIMGTVLVSISFAFIYTPPPGHNPDTNPWSSLHMVSRKSITHSVTHLVIYLSRHELVKFENYGISLSGNSQN